MFQSYFLDKLLLAPSPHPCELFPQLDPGADVGALELQMPRIKLRDRSETLPVSFAWY